MGSLKNRVLKPRHVCVAMRNLPFVDLFYVILYVLFLKTLQQTKTNYNFKHTKKLLHNCECFFIACLFSVEGKSVFTPFSTVPKAKLKKSGLIVFVIETTDIPMNKRNETNVVISFFYCFSPHGNNTI
mmetsp:Transcript_20333/g.20606  ORF Transcript_20333/g.20606 Transcript_20333/m.20606 type:complete len:128 (-) Transcript_20333:87-470(-)